jgi:sulfide:quinone oxidoreductase
MAAGRASANLDPMADDRTRVTIVGGGVAALEAVLALRALAEDRVHIELVTPRPEFVHRPLAVAEPFGLGEARRYDIQPILKEHGVVLHLAGAQAVEPKSSTLRTWDGRALEYELLLIAMGARPTVSLPGSISLKGPGYTNRFRTMLRELDERRVHKVAFVVPPGASWPLPLYELALLTASHVADRQLRGVELHLVTPEAEPLELFGPAGVTAVRALLDERGVIVHTGRHATEVRAGELVLLHGDALPVERVVSLPRLVGPALPGVPHDPEGFISVDLYGHVRGVPRVYAAGDVTTCPIKQGGVAAQQADAAAETIAAAAGAPVKPRPFRPVLRGLLLTGGTPRFMRAEVAGGRGGDWQVADHALWWPPSKVAGHYLAPYLALRHEELEKPSGGLEMDIDLGLGAVRRRVIVGRTRDGRATATRLPV